ncbi:MAG: SH3 domain-containing protein [Chloroflexi bacterium]|nr:SH3 domain-containing protein [Chloroflexota bacterium]
MRQKVTGILGIVLIFGLMLAVSTNSQAQEINTIGYGDTVQGTISPATPLAIYNFTGAVGDLVVVQVTGITLGMNPGVSLLAPSQEQLASNDDNPFEPNSTDARIDFRLPDNGVYTLLVGGSDGSQGDFALRLILREPTFDIPLSPGSTTRAALPQDAPPQTFSFNSNPLCPIFLTASAETPGFGFIITLRDFNGRTLAVINDLDSAVLEIPLGDSSYEVTLESLDPRVEGVVLLSLTGCDDLPTATPEVTNTPVPTLTATPRPFPTPTVCSVAATGANIRTGPGLNFDIVGVLRSGTLLQALGLSPDGIWYAVNFGGAQAWISSTVSVLLGPCGGLPVLPSPPTPTPSPSITPTFTFTPSLTPTFTPTTDVPTGPNNVADPAANMP